MVKTNGNQIALFGQNGNVAVGGANTGFGLPAPIASGNNSFAIGSGSIASGNFSLTGGVVSQATGLLSFAFGENAVSSGNYSFSFGLDSQAIGNRAISFGTNLASGENSFAFGIGTTASGAGSTAWGQNSISSAESTTSFGYGSQSIANYAVSWGVDTLASGGGSTAAGIQSVASGENSFAFGNQIFSRSLGEVGIGIANTDYISLDTGNFNSFDRLFSIGNGNSSPHNAYTLWKDGSFAYNDDNFQNDTPGTEQNMFYFNYGNHDGLGNVNTKRAIRLGSAVNDEWDISSSNVGDRSVAIGFGISGFGMPSATASGMASFALGTGTRATNIGSFALGIASQSTGTASVSIGYAAKALADNSVAIGDGSTVNGKDAVVIGYQSSADGERSLAFGTQGLHAYGFEEFAFGAKTTVYSPSQVLQSDPASGLDRLFIVGKGGGAGSDALTILKNGQTGIGIDNFEANTNGNIFQVGDGSTGIIGYVDNGTGNWMAVSDERKKHNITDIQYGLNEILQLKPVSFDYNRNNEHTIGFLAQQVLPIIPEAVGGNEQTGYSMSYATLTPAIVKAIQELNLKVDVLSLNTGTTSTNIFDSLKNWLGDVGNGVQKIFAHEVQTDKLCVGQTCVTESQLQQLLQNQTGSNQSIITPVVDSPPSSDTGSDNSNTPTIDTVPPTTSDTGSANTPVIDVPSTLSDSGSVTE
jgi:hypothetical protein